MLGSPRIRVKRRSGLHQKVNTARDVGMTEMLRDRPYEGAFHGRTHRFALRVYFDDTDTAGIVYYVHHLSFLDRETSVHPCRGMLTLQPTMEIRTGVALRQQAHNQNQQH